MLEKSIENAKIIMYLPGTDEAYLQPTPTCFLCLLGAEC